MQINEDLKELVSKSISCLGNAILEIHGKKVFETIETVRVKMKSVRGEEAQRVLGTMNAVYEDFKHLNTQDLHKVAKSFSLMLELINSCEASYRTHRLRSFKPEKQKKSGPEELIFVFTGHPTEARSKSFLMIMEKIEGQLLSSLEGDFSDIEDKLSYLLKIGLKLNLANNKRPQVRDEAEHIIHTVLNKDIIHEQISLKKKNVNVLFRTWVGGDKDGHPKVGPATMIQCMNLSRQRIIAFKLEKLETYLSEIKTTKEKSLIRLALLLKKNLRSMSKVTKSDGKKVARFTKDFDTLLKQDKLLKIGSPELVDISILLKLYPALVLPLEIREDSELIHTALKNSKQTVSRMLQQLKSISVGFDPKWYVRGFVISMCQETDDILAAVQLIKKNLGSYSIPAVPLFENEKGLSNGVEILKKSFQQFPFLKLHQTQWKSRFEVMLGYSDSTKESGVLPGRLLVENSLHAIDKFLISQKFTPVFFHGSGGSISRGGGSAKDQVSWWPKSALNIYKVTIQGEMVHRQFHHALIMQSQVSKIVNEYVDYKPRKVTKSVVVDKFAKSIQTTYRELVKDDNFHDLISKVTPYDYLNLLKIGSRPAKRSTAGNFSLRAIPWILCWTQTRLLLPIWWGVGSSWVKLSSAEQTEFINLAQTSPLLQTYIKNLGFTLAKIELGVWKFHVSNSALSKESQTAWNNKIDDELNLVKSFFKQVSSNKNYTWFRPMLGESINFRSSMIHPLNIIQKISLERNDQLLLRETVTGIACGMLTTG